MHSKSINNIRLGALISFFLHWLDILSHWVAWYTIRWRYINTRIVSKFFLCIVYIVQIPFLVLAFFCMLICPCFGDGIKKTVKEYCSLMLHTFELYNTLPREHEDLYFTTALIFVPLHDVP